MVNTNRVKVAEEKNYPLITIQFIDAHSFDVRSLKKACVHIVHPDGRLIPFDSNNLFYRDDLERTRLTPLRQSVSGGSFRAAQGSGGERGPFRRRGTPTQTSRTLLGLLSDYELM